MRNLEKEYDLEILKNRCKSFLNSEEKKKYIWTKLKKNLYISLFNLIGPEVGVLSKLERKFEDGETKYILSFNDMQQILDDQSYGPLRILGDSVFNELIS